jgi:hypothetical protein
MKIKSIFRQILIVTKLLIIKLWKTLQEVAQRTN